LPACCATATEPDSSSAVNMTSPDRILAILDSPVRFKRGPIEIVSETRQRRSAHSFRMGNPTLCDYSKNAIAGANSSQLPGPLFLEWVKISQVEGGSMDVEIASWCPLDFGFAATS
jgi:hypothetical protein